MYNIHQLQKIISEGITINSSGTSGSSKPYFQPPKKIKAASEVAIKVQNISKNSKIYTCCKLTHAGGLLAQTIPGAIVGATVDIVPFNAYSFVKEIKNYTHSHITPLHAKAIMLTKNFKNLDLSGITIMCGAEPVTWDIIESFVSRNCKFIVNWGMSEIGPVAINHTFNTLEDVERVKSICPSNSVILGSDVYCDFKILEDGELVVKGDISIIDGWYHTKDIVTLKDRILFYNGRKNLQVDFYNPKKG
jgi:hypothetical protein